MIAESILERPLVGATGIVLVATVISLYFLLVTPIVAMALVSFGWKWRRTSARARRNAGTVILAGGAFLLVLSYVIYAGVLRQPGFEGAV